MKKDKAWLKDLINEEGIVMNRNSLGRHDAQYWKNENIKINKGRLFYLIDQLVEPQKPVIPQFVADYIEKWKYADIALGTWFTFNYETMEDNEVSKWLYDNTTEEKSRREYLLIGAVLNGYEVEKEPVYFAKIKGHELVQTETVLDDDTGDDISEFCRNVYFVLQRNGELVIDMKDSGLSGATHVMTMIQWNNLGINETNADFEAVN